MNKDIDFTSSANSSVIFAQLSELLSKRLEAKRLPLAESFVKQYFNQIAPEELANFDVENLYGAAMAHLGFISKREPGVSKVRIYNPRYDEHGWESKHTVIEIAMEDKPFLVDSLRMLMDRKNVTTHLLIHPVLSVQRDKQSVIQAIDVANDESTQIAKDATVVREAIMHFEIDRQIDSARLEALEKGVHGILNDVRASTEDWQQMQHKLQDILAEIEITPLSKDEAEQREYLDFLRWVGDNHFTFLGYREFTISGSGKDVQLEKVASNGLGLLRDGQGLSISFSRLPEDVRNIFLSGDALILTKSDLTSTVHRQGYMDYIGIKRFDAEGSLIGEHRFVGLYTSAAYNRVPSDIPILHLKQKRIMAKAALPESSHAAKALSHIIDTFPRDELFQLDAGEIYESAMGILHLQERRRVRLFIHRERFRRFYSCMVFVPRERFNTDVRLKIQKLLESELGASSAEFTVQLSESVLARLFFVMHVDPHESGALDIKQIEEKINQITRSWSDQLKESLLDHFGEENGPALHHRYGQAFRADYIEAYNAKIAATDVEKMEQLGEDKNNLAMHLYRPLEAQENQLNFKVFFLNKPFYLSDTLPMLEHMGLRVEGETPSFVTRDNGDKIYIHDFELRFPQDLEIDLGKIRETFHQTFAQVFAGQVEDDGFNSLVLYAGLDWRSIVVLRAYCKYLRQLGFTFSQDYMEKVLANNKEITHLLVQQFTAKFDPEFDDDRNATKQTLDKQILVALDKVASLDEDRILRAFRGLIDATLRTNHYQLAIGNGNYKSYLSFKLNPERIGEMPKPKPMFEIFVYSPKVEGVHLRGGPVARGGLRWSDRREDFRTEILGLVKAQMVKNAVIVPLGSKGGFYPKQLPMGDREAMLKEGISCYKTFIKGLLDITDNLVEGAVVPPTNVVRHDKDDPYLVVAADKGTATFSDIANQIAVDYGFWLGDAFASGGSVGYDHKGMGITARGAWESVKRHFRERGVNTQNETFTVVGIGDMSGDVFGNGMLLSEHIKLLAAFNHLHIFIDPDPDPAVSFVERQRMFQLPRSTWNDYDKSLISKGGDIFSRQEKSIPISAQMKECFDIKEDALTPTALISVLLSAPIDLLWNGGIGTYVKASDEPHNEVGDRANDSLRVDGKDLRCKVIGEGGNLGFTQRGRIEFAQTGGNVFTDAIDNSAGVDCSDHEVNIKILLNAVIAAGDITDKQRNELLASMTDEVAELVLTHNYLQTQSLSLAVFQAPQLIDVHARLIRSLERAGELDRAIEFLPSEDEISERKDAGKGLTAPELAVLIAYAKLSLYQALLKSDFASDPYLQQVLKEYFPGPLQQKYQQLFSEHRLWREIICTIISNDAVNRAGITYLYRVNEETGATSDEIARAYLVAKEVFGLPELWSQIEALDNRVEAKAQTMMLLEARKLCERAARWFLRNRELPLDIQATVDFFKSGVSDVLQCLPKVAPQASVKGAKKKVSNLTAMGVPEELAQHSAWLDELYSALDIVTVASTSESNVEETASVYFKLNDKLGFTWLREQVVNLPRRNRWETLARTALRDDLFAQERNIAASVINYGEADMIAEKRISAWIGAHKKELERPRKVLVDLQSFRRTDFSMLSVAMRELRGIQESIK